MRLLKYLLAIVAAIAALIGLAWAAGLALPRDHRAPSTIVLHAPREAVWSALVDVGRFMEWRSGLDEVTVVDPAPGATRWVEIGSTAGFPSASRSGTNFPDSSSRSIPNHSPSGVGGFMISRRSESGNPGTRRG